VHYFGSLEKAIVTLKKQGKRLPGWNRRKIMTVLSEMHRSNESLAYGRVRREFPATAERRRSPFWKLGQGVVCGWDQPKFVFCASQVAQIESAGGSDMMIDDDTLKQLLRINDETQLDRLFRASGLYREKWDRRCRGDGATYGQATITKAIGH
jgi:hypothetical protein